MEPQWRAIGNHSIRVLGDLVEMRQSGMLSLAEAMEYFRQVEAVSAEYGYSLSLFEQNQATGIEASARSFIGQRAKALRSLSALAVVGASLPLRTLAQLILRAINMIRTPPLAIGFFGTELEARTYLVMYRNEFRAKLKPPEPNRPAYR